MSHKIAHFSDTTAFLCFLFVITDVLDGKERNYLIPTHIHGLLHCVFYLLGCACDDSVQLLNENGVLKLIGDELEAFVLLPEWDMVCKIWLPT